MNYLVQCSHSIAAVVILYSLLFVACNKPAGGTPASDERPNGPITFDRFPLVRGSSVGIHYHGDHQRAEFKQGQELYVAVEILSLDGIAILRLPFVRRATEKKYAVTFDIPDNARILTFTVSPIEVYESSETFTTAVYDGSAPVRGSLPHLIAGAGSLEKAMDLFAEDEQLYPGDNGRWISLWFGTVRSGMPGEDVRRSADSLWASLSDAEQYDGESYLDGCAACAFAYSAGGDWRRVDSALIRIREALQKNRSPLSLLSGNALNSVIAMIADTIVSQRKHSDVADSIISHLADVIAVDSDIALADAFLTNLDSLSLRKKVVRTATEKIASSLDGAMTNRSFLSEGAATPSIFLSSGRVLLWVGDHARAARMLGRGVNVLDSIPAWVSSDLRRPVTRFLIRPLPPSVALLQATAFERLSAFDSARAVYTRIVDSTTLFTLGPGSLAAANNARLFLREGDLAGAEKYCAIAFQLESPFADSILMSIRDERARRRLPLVEKDALVARYPYRTTSGHTMPDLSIATSKGILNPALVRDTLLYLFFVSEDCSVCREYIPTMEKELQKASTPHRAIIISRDPSAALEKTYGSGPEFAALTGELAIGASVASFPTVLVVRDRKIISRKEGLSRETADELVMLARKR